MFLRDIPIPKLIGTKLSHDGKYAGVIVDVNKPSFVDPMILTIEMPYQVYGQSTTRRFEHNYDQAKDFFEVLDDELPITQPAPVQEKPCKNKWCQKLNYTTDKQCWNCETENPTDY